MKFRREHRLKLISFLIATTLWYFVVWGKPVEKVLEVPVIYHPVNPDYIVETKISDGDDTILRIKEKIFIINDTKPVSSKKQ